MTKEDLTEKAKAIHKRVITLDSHCDIDIRNFTEKKNYTQDLDAQVTLPKMEKGGLDVVWLVVYTAQNKLNDAGFKLAYKDAIAKFDAIHRLTSKIAPNQIELALTSADVRRIVKSGKKVAMIGVENGYSIGTDITNVKKFYDLGARYMSLSHNGHSQLCDSNTGEATNDWLHNGLSALGKQVIKEMNACGMMVDVSHPSREAMLQMIELSKAPIIASHSSARALCDHPRNLDDEQLQLMKENGGVVQAVAFQAYTNTEKHTARKLELDRIQKKISKNNNVRWFDSFDDVRASGMSREEMISWYDQYKEVVKEADHIVASIDDFPPAVDIVDFVNHIDYMVDKIGIEHVGISSDFDGGGGVDGWNDASEALNVTIELVNRGYNEESIAALWSGNLLRVLDQCQEIAKNLS